MVGDKDIHHRANDHCVFFIVGNGLEYSPRAVHLVGEFPKLVDQSGFHENIKMFGTD